MSAIRLLLLHPADNVLVTAQAVKEGQTLEIAGHPVTVPRPIALGHKIASRAIPRGAKIIKYGVSIGTAAEAIAPGDHVHLHNLRSDYLPTL